MNIIAVRGYTRLVATTRERHSGAARWSAGARPIARTLRLLAVLALAGVIAAACGASSPTTAPTPCGGSHTWPPNEYAPMPAGLSVELVSGTTVRVANETDRAWVVRVAAWEDTGCAGYLTADAPLRDLAAHSVIEATVADPGWGGQLRIGIEFWDHSCDEACTDEPTGFGSVDPVASPLPS